MPKRAHIDRVIHRLFSGELLGVLQVSPRYEEYLTQRAYNVKRPLIIARYPERRCSTITMSGVCL